jgi:hypothetical protein
VAGFAIDTAGSGVASIFEQALEGPAQPPPVSSPV